MKKSWMLFGKEIDSSLRTISELVVVVNREFVDELEEKGIPYGNFSKDAKRTNLIKRGRNSKRFDNEKVKEIRNSHIEGLSYRKLAKKYECSTSIIYKIIKGKY